MRLILVTIPIFTLLGVLATLPGAAKTTLVEAGGRIAISTEAANTGGGAREKHFLNNYRTSLIRQDGKIEKISLYVASKPASITAFFFEVWRKQGETWNRISQENIWPSVKGGQVNDITLKSAPLAQEADYIGYGYTCTSDPGLFLTAATDPDLYDPAGAYNNKSYATEAEPSAKNFDWAVQTPLMLYVPIKVYMQPPVMVFTGDSIISGAPGHLSFVDTYFPGAYPGRAPVGIDPSTTIPYKVGKALKVSYQNMAMAGATSEWVLKNVFNDCVKLKPRVMVISVGVNDVSTSSNKAGFLANYTTMLNACTANNIKPVVNLLTPRTDLADAKSRELDDWNVSLIALANKYGAVIVDARAAVGQFREGGDPGNIWALKQEYAADVVHFKPAGHTKIAEVMVETIKKSKILEGSSVKPKPLTKEGTWQSSVVRQMNGPGKEIKLPGLFQAVTQDWNCEVAQPHIVYIPEKNRVLMLEGMNMPYQAVLTYSDDWGATWSKPRLLHTDAEGKCDVGHSLGLTYLGDGKLIMTSSSRWFSSDYGETWQKWAEVPPGIGGAGWGLWDPMLVDFDAAGKATRLMEGPHICDNSAYYGERGNDCSQGYVWFSTDEGKTWTPPAKVPEWRPVNETTFVRAKNGDIVAACRIDYPAKFRKELNDNYGGLGVSISKDNGLTWSKVKMLYQWGRHHASLVCMPNGDIVMAYLVRRGYRYTADGYPRFAIEAIVSRDNGQTWDLDHKYILTEWGWDTRGPSICAWGGPCGTSSVLLPDGSILTTFRTGRRAKAAGNGRFNPQDAELVRWRLNYEGLSADHAIADASPTSDPRNRFDPDLTPRKPATGRKNIAVLSQGAKVTASQSDGDISGILYDEYYDYTRVSLKTIPGWIQISWPKAHKISEARIYTGNNPEFANLPRECAPLDYKLQYKKGAVWVDLVPPVTNAPMWKDFEKTSKQGDEFYITHKFAPVSTKAIRMYITKTSSPDTKETVIRMIKVF